MSAMANEAFKEEREMREERHSGPLKYFIIWGVLMVLTVVTVLTGRMHLPDWGLVLALVIATVKGTLVALYFMHLADHKGANRLVFGVSVFFVVLLIGFVMGDLSTRFRPALPTGTTAPYWQLGPEGTPRYGSELKAPEPGRP